MQAEPTAIRRLTPADAPEYRSFRLRGLKESPSSYGRSYGQELKEPLSFFKKKLKVSPENWMFGYLRKGKLVGVIYLARDAGAKERHKASLYGLYVEPRARRQGVARALMQTAMDQARELKIRQLRLGVVSPNGSAQGLYEKLGFAEYGREKDARYVAGKFYDEILMVRKL